MLAEIGLISVVLALTACLYAVGAAVLGVRTHSDRLVVSAHNAALLTFPLLLVASVALLAALLGQQYNIAYVWQTSDPNTPLFYRITALWGSQQGSLLFWCLLMSGFAVGALLLNWRTNRRLMPYVIAYTMATLAFFVALVVFLENPFDRYWWVDDGTQTGAIVAAALQPADSFAVPARDLAADARGLNPLLRHFGMIIHPPMLYLGFVGMLIPFAFAMAALASGDLSTNWIKATRRWNLVAWLFLSLGLILGGRWAYDVLGWGGYWGWDPVENAAFLPWLLGTAFLHSVMIQEKRGMLKVWNMFLIILTFSAVIFGTFATRSGLVESVHSFAQSEIGFPMFAFWAGITVISIALILWRWNRGELRDEHQFTGIVSRETMFVLNNVIFVSLAILIFWGSFGAPILSELFLTVDITLGTEYFLNVTPPLFIVLYILMGVAPLTAWGTMSVGRLGRSIFIPAVLTLLTVVGLYALGTRMFGALLGYGIVVFAGYVALYEIYRGAMARRRAQGESLPQALVAIFGRNRRRYGGFIVHLGITVIGIGVIGSTLFQMETQQTLTAGESLDIGGYQMVFNGLDNGQISEDGRVMDIANVAVVRDGQTLTTLRPRHDFYPGAQGMNTMTIAAAHSTIENDFYVLLTGWDTIAGTATFKVYVNPLINLVWWGGLILIVGTFISVWPTESTARSRQQAPIVTGARATA
ncbi:MAG: heme lyase CcmF/NrfE family subunit [Chloroflexi bacterium]|nr:heme lyase CcmF/NrfE family subunit [Chloroflexota bacterium]